MESRRAAQAASNQVLQAAAGLATVPEKREGESVQWGTEGRTHALADGQRGRLIARAGGRESGDSYKGQAQGCGDIKKQAVSGENQHRTYCEGAQGCGTSQADAVQ